MFRISCHLHETRLIVQLFHCPPAIQVEKAQTRNMSRVDKENGDRRQALFQQEVIDDMYPCIYHSIRWLRKVSSVEVTRPSWRIVVTTSDMSATPAKYADAIRNSCEAYKTAPIFDGDAIVVQPTIRRSSRIASKTSAE